MTFDFKKWLDEGPIKLTRGVGNPETGGCWMAGIAMYSGVEWGDHPPCVCPVIRSLCIVINDQLSDDKRGEVIGSMLLDPIGTNGNAEDTEKRRWILVDAAIRIWTPDALDFAGLDSSTLRNLPQVTKENHASAANAAAAANANAAAAANANAAKVASAAAEVDAEAYAEAYDEAYAASVEAYAAQSATASLYAVNANAAAAANGTALQAAESAAYANAAKAASLYATAAKDQYIIDKIIPVLKQLLDVGNYMPVEMNCTIPQLNKCVQRA